MGEVKLLPCNSAEFCCVRKMGDYVFMAITPKGEETLRYWLSLGGAEVLAAEISGALSRPTLVTGQLDQGVGWQPIETAPKGEPGCLGPTIMLWHLRWNCPVSALWQGGPGPLECRGWLEKTLTTVWPDEAFSHWRQPLEPPAHPQPGPSK